MKHNWFLSLLLTGFVILPLSLITAQKQITIDDIWTNGTFRSKGVPGFRFMNDGHHYTALQNNKIIKSDLRTGNVADTMLDVSVLKLPLIKIKLMITPSARMNPKSSSRQAQKPFTGVRQKNGTMSTTWLQVRSPNCQTRINKCTLHFHPMEKKLLLLWTMISTSKTSIREKQPE